jgi:protein O-mannosyl-transferase
MPLFRSRLFSLFIIIIAGVMAYSNSLNAAFIFDDLPTIPRNASIPPLWPIWNALAFDQGGVAIGRPMAGLTFALNYAIGKNQTYGYHVFNLLIHILSALILCGVVRRTLAWGRLKADYASASPFLGLGVALIWLLHPLQTESVTYISQRTESLMGLFFLLTLYFFIRSVQGNFSFRWKTIAVLTCALGMASKEVMVTCPLIILFYDRVFCGSWREILKKRLCFYLCLASTWGILIKSLFVTLPAGMNLGYAGFFLESLTPLTNLKTQVTVVLHYIKLVFWPHPLVLDYFNWPIVQSLSSILPQLFIMLSLLGATVWAVFKRPVLGFLGIWFFLILAPSSSFLPMPTEIAAEKRMYLPLIAWCVLFVVGGYHLLNKLKRRSLFSLALVLLLIIAAVLGWFTYLRNEDYQSRHSIWKDTVQKRPENSRAWKNYGNALLDKGKHVESTYAFKRAIELQPSPEAYNDLGVALWRWDKLEAARQAFEDAVNLDRRHTRAHINLAELDRGAGKVPKAIKRLEDAIGLVSDKAFLYGFLADLYMEEESLLHAHGAYLEALQLDARNARWLNNLGVIHVKRGEPGEAIKLFEQALSIQPDYLTAQLNLEKSRQDQILIEQLMLDGINVYE